MRNITEKTGIILVLIHAAIYGVYPIIVSSGAGAIPPITFAALSAIVAAVVATMVLIVSGKLPALRNLSAWRPIIMITIFIVVIPAALFFWGVQHTSGANAALLLQSELIFTIIITPLFGEKPSWLKLAGGLLVLAGTIAILYNGTLQFNWGDLIIIASTATYPLGNFYNKQALTMLPSRAILAGRYALGSIVLLLLAISIEGTTTFTTSLTQLPWWQIIFTGAGVFVFAKLVFYTGMRTMDITKFTFINSVSPAFGLIGAIVLLSEQPSIYQWLGLLLIMGGALIAAIQPSTPLHNAKYGSHTMQQ